MPAGSERSLPRTGACLVFAALLAGAAGPPPASVAPAPRPTTARGEPRPDVVLITIDTLRADHCSVHGYARRTTPFLEQLAAGSVVFDAASSASSWTPPSMASIFTGLPPRAHGVIHGTVQGDVALEQEYLDESFPVLAETFARAGYWTAGISTNSHLARRTGFARGFRLFREIPWVDAPQVNTAAAELLAGRPAGRPMFLWVHYVDPHASYQARAPYIDGVGLDPALVARWSNAPPSAWRLEMRKPPGDGSLRGTLHALYDSEVAAADAALRQLVKDHVAAGAVVAVTSDHGESLIDRGFLGHGNSLHQEEVHVPLLVRVPGEAPRRVAAPVGNADLFATLCEAAGVPLPKGVPGTSLLTRPSAASPGTAPRDGAADAPVVTELDRPPFEHGALRMGPLKLYRRHAPRRSVQLFDLAADPRERRDLAAEGDARVAGLVAALDAWQRRNPRFTRARIVEGPSDPEEIERLRALGYVGGARRY